MPPWENKDDFLTPHLYVATGFQKWGMTTSMVAARLLRDEICGWENEYKKVFTPQRFHVRAGWKDFRKDVCVSAKSLWKGFWNGRVKKEIPYCSHLGCALYFNAEEQTWECSCHGSRFKEDGNLLDHPAGNHMSG